MTTELKDVSSHEGTLDVLGHKVTVRWWGGPLEDMIPLLMEDAEEHTRHMITQGYLSGELLWEDESRSFKGYWQISSKED